MKQDYELAELLVAAWKLANGDERIPTSHGVLDRALRTVISDGGLPEWARQDLTFADTRVGLRCLELPEILDCAQESSLTSEPNYRYLTTAVQIDENVCERLLRDLGVDLEDARKWGQSLKHATREIIELDEVTPTMIEAV